MTSFSINDNIKLMTKIPQGVLFNNSWNYIWSRCFKAKDACSLIRFKFNLIAEISCNFVTSLSKRTVRFSLKLFFTKHTIDRLFNHFYYHINDSMFSQCFYHRIGHWCSHCQWLHN